MFVAIYIKAPVCYATSGESKGQVFRKLVQMGLNPDDFIIKKAKKEKNNETKQTINSNRRETRVGG